MVVVPNGEIVDQVGGEIKNGKVVFSTPLIDYLLLAEPIIYKVSFK